MSRIEAWPWSVLCLRENTNKPHLLVDNSVWTTCFLTSVFLQIQISNIRRQVQTHNSGIISVTWLRKTSTSGGRFVIRFDTNEADSFVSKPLFTGIPWVIDQLAISIGIQHYTNFICLDTIKRPKIIGISSMLCCDDAVKEYFWCPVIHTTVKLLISNILSMSGS